MNTNRSNHNSILIMSIIIMLSLVIIPFSTGWRFGIIPDVEDLGHAFIDVFQEIAEDGGKAFRNIVVRGTLLAVVCDVVLIFAAACKSKCMDIIASLGGVSTLTWFLIKYIELNDFDAVFDLDDCGTTIGFWVPYILFIICFVFSLKIKSKNERSLQ